MLAIAGCGRSAAPARQAPVTTATTAFTSSSPVRTSVARASGSIRTNFGAANASLANLRTLENRACRRLVDELVTLPGLSAELTFKALLDREIMYLARFNATIYALSAPPSRAADYHHFVYANEGALYLFRRLVPYLVGADRNKAQAEQLMERGAVADRDARRYGRRLRLSACATGQMHRG